MGGPVKVVYVSTPPDTSAILRPGNHSKLVHEVRGETGWIVDSLGTGVSVLQLYHLVVQRSMGGYTERC